MGSHLRSQRSRLRRAAFAQGYGSPGATTRQADVRHASGSESATARRGESVLWRIRGQRSEVRRQKKIEHLKVGLAQLIRSLPAPLTLSGLPTYVAGFPARSIHRDCFGFEEVVLARFVRT